jgi:hypothetical protein
MTDVAAEPASTVVEPFTPVLIQRFLKSQGLRYFVSEENEYLVIFDADDTKPEVLFSFSPSGNNASVYSIRARAIAPAGRELSEWYELVNNWSRDWRWPTAYVIPGEHSVLYIYLEAHYQLASGIHQALFDELSQTIITGVSLFFDELATRDRPQRRNVEGESQ